MCVCMCAPVCVVCVRVRREADETTGKDGEMHAEFPAALGELVHEAFDQCFSHCFTPRST